MAVLQHLLEAELVDIDDDSQMEKLSAAAAFVQDQLAEGKIGIAPATLVAMDPQVNGDEPVLDAVYAAVSAQWSTVKKRHPDRPVALLRGVLAQALAAAGASDVVASVIWPTASSYAPYASLAREQEVWTRILLPIGERSERAAAEAWSGRGGESRVEIPVPDLPAISASANGLDTATLTAYLAAAAGPVDNPPAGAKTNNNVISQGPYGGAHAQPAWADTFGTTAAAGITRVVNAALVATVKGLDLGPLKASLEEHTAGISRAVTDALAPLHAIELRSRVLIWREALYSRSQRRPYREIPAPLAVVSIAADLAAEVPPMSPASVDNLAWEAGHAVLGNAATTIAEFAAALTDLDDPSLAELLGSNTDVQGRKTLLSFVRAVIAEGEAPSDVRAQLGVRGSVEIPLPDLVRWLFRDLRAERIAADAAPRGRRRRK
jgi:hypothetical protein